MDDIVIRIVVAILACAWIAEIFKGLFQKRKVNASAGRDDADGAQIIVNSAKILLEPLTQKIKEAEVEITSLKASLRGAEDQVATLQSRLSAATNQLSAATAENQKISLENRRLRQLLAGESHG